MANQSRVVELQIKLQGVQSLQQLEEVTAEINNELKGVATTSKEFTAMGDLAKKANSKLKEVNTSLEGITSTEKAEAVNKMGQGLVGAFQAAAGASLIFGEKTGKEMEAVIKKVGGLFAVTDGLKKLTEAFSAKNVAALKATVKGWQESTIAAKLFGNGVKTALISTGIGALVVLLGVIIANFDKIKSAGKKALDGVRESNSLLLAPLKAVIGFFDKMIEKVGSIKALLKGLGAAITAIFQGDFKNIGKAFDEAIVKQNELDAAAKKYKETIIDTNDEFENQLALLTEIGGKEQEILDLQKKRNQEIVDILSKKQDLTEDEAKALKDANFQLELLGIKQINLNKKRQEEAKIAQEKAAQEKKTADEKAAADKKAAEDRKKLIDDLTEEIKLSQSKFELLALLSVIESNAYGLRVRNRDISKEELNIEIDKDKILKDAVNSNEELKRLAEERKQINDDLNAGYLTEVQAKKLSLNNDIETLHYSNKIMQITDSILKNLSETNKRKILLLQYDKDALELQKQSFESDAKNNIQKDIDLNKQLLDLQKEEAELIKQKKSEEEIGAVRAKMLEIEKEIIDTWNVDLEIKSQILKIDEEISNVNKEINGILVENTNELAGQANVAKTLNERYSEGLDKFFTKYGELIGASRDLANAAFDLAIQNAEAEAEAEIKILEDKAKAEIEIQEEIIDEKKKLQEDYADSLNELNDLLADAEGERYDDILAQIREEEAAKNDAREAEITAEQEKARIENQLLIDKQNEEKKAAKLRKTQAIVDAVINTALAVLSALKSGFPLGLIMAGVYAALGAVQIATISKQPTYAEGGFTKKGGKYEPAGIVHAGEYVVPQRIVRNPQAQGMLETLEGMRLRGYAEGGTVAAPTPNIPTAENMLDYARIGNEVARALKENPMFVSWQEWKETDNRMRWVQGRASIGNK
jgi:hypothetical protein